MARDNVAIVAFNRGIISPKALARTDIKRVQLSAETQTNFMPRVVGPMMLRPGLGMVGSTYNNALANHLPFVFARDDKALLEFTGGFMRVMVDDTPISRVAVSTSIGDGTMAGTGSWVDADESGATSTVGSGQMILVGTKFNAAIRSQQVMVGASDQNVEHAIRIVVSRGPVMLRVGSSDGDDDYISETSLGTGSHSLVLTPTANFHIRLFSVSTAQRIVTSCSIEAAGEMVLPSPYSEDLLRKIRFDQSADVMYLACKGLQQMKVERRATRSWSIVAYQPEDGPFRNDNITTTRLTASAISGNITLTASRALFKSSHVGALFRATSVGQQVQQTVTGDNQWSNPIKVVGVGSAARGFYINITGVWVANIKLQRSIGEPGAWTDVTTYTANQSNLLYDDGLNNQTTYYRIGIDAGGWTSGSAVVSLTSYNGSITGIARITAYTNPTTVSAEVLEDFGGTSATDDWAEGEWSPRRGYPTAVALHEGRLWFAGKSKIIGSVSDAYESFDDTVEGDSAPINRSIGSGPVDNINWILSLSRLLAGTDGSEWSARSSSLDEPLSATNFNLKSPTSQGSAEAAAIKIDDRCLFIQGSGERIFQMANDSSTAWSYGYGDYTAAHLTELVPELGQSGYIKLVAQRQPDTRVHALRADGKVVVIISQPAEEVLCFVLVETDGTIEDVVLLPGDGEDQVYYTVARTINGVTYRFRERWAMESECVGGAITKLADCFITYDGAATTTLSVPHLAGEDVVVWADGMDLALYDREPDNPRTFTVSGGGTLTLPVAVSQAVVGLGYQANYVSSKLAYAASGGTALTQVKRVDHAAFILADTHYQGVKIGGAADKMDPLPRKRNEAKVADHTVFSSYDHQGFAVNTSTESDARIYIQAAAPRPCTVMAAVLSIATYG